MPTATEYTMRSSWENKFDEPTIDDLRAGFGKQVGALIDGARDKLCSYEPVDESVSWQGVPWRWTMVYSAPDLDDRPIAYLVLDPQRPLIAIPMTAELVESIPMHRLKKHVRDGVLLSRKVVGVYWSTWELTSKSQLQDILELVHRKMKLLTAPK